MSSDDATPESPTPSSRRAERVEAIRRAVDQAAGAVADEVQQAVGKLGRTLDVRPASADEVRRLTDRVERLERETDQRLARIEARLGIDPLDARQAPPATASDAADPDRGPAVP